MSPNAKGVIKNDGKIALNDFSWFVYASDNRRIESRDGAVLKAFASGVKRKMKVGGDDEDMSCRMNNVALKNNKHEPLFP